MIISYLCSDIAFDQCARGGGVSFNKDLGQLEFRSVSVSWLSTNNILGFLSLPFDLEVD